MAAKRITGQRLPQLIVVRAGDVEQRAWGASINKENGRGDSKNRAEPPRPGADWLRRKVAVARGVFRKFLSPRPGAEIFAYEHPLVAPQLKHL